MDSFVGTIGTHLGESTPLTEAVVRLLLGLARDVAHATERRNAPLAAYLAGRYAEMRRADGIDAETAIAEVNLMARRWLRLDGLDPDAKP